MFPAFPSSKTGSETLVQVPQPCCRCAQFDRIHGKVLLLTSMNRPTGQRDSSSLLYASNRQNLQYQSDAVELADE
jgi:hypothetical protein